MPRESSQFNILWFLELYKQYPCLWDKNLREYKDRRKRDQAECELLQKAGFENVKFLRMKIRSIRGTYNNELRKIMMRNKSGVPYQPKLHWFEYADSFLNKNYESDCDATKNWTVNNEYENESQIEENDTKEWQVSQSDSRQMRAEKRPAETAPSTSKQAKENNASSVESNPSVRSSDALEDAVSNLQVTNTRIFNNNEFALFGLTVGLQLSKLPLRKALELQQNIQSLITTARIIELESSFNFSKSASFSHT